MRQLRSSHLTRVISCTEAPIFAIEIGTDMRSLLQFLNLGVLREWLGVATQFQYRLHPVNDKEIRSPIVAKGSKQLYCDAVVRALSVDL
jgi:hypothetical protein